MYGTEQSIGVLWYTDQSSGELCMVLTKAVVCYGTVQSIGVLWYTDLSIGVLWYTDQSIGVLWYTDQSADEHFLQTWDYFLPAHLSSLTENHVPSDSQD